MMAFSPLPSPVHFLPSPRGILVKREINIKHSDTRNIFMSQWFRNEINISAGVILSHHFEFLFKFLSIENVHKSFHLYVYKDS